ncbi:MAG: ribose-phosphate pyrophosphokinase [Armatimonadetes bacterium]|nr:ribose-phosphate pyrophosphokinase [Armatimonadota bacterium]
MTPTINGAYRIFCGNANPKLAESIAAELGTDLGDMQVTHFSDGEVQVKINESVRGLDIFVVQPCCAPVNERIMELLVIIDAFRRASARRITVVLPYYPYARQDKKYKPREPITARLIADLITVAGASRILTIDLHAGQIEGYFNLPVDHLRARPIIAEYLRSRGLVDKKIVVVSPDVGGVTRARSLAEDLGSPIAIIAKRRPEPNRSEVMEVIGDVKGRIAVMIDDMIDTGGSLVQGAAAIAEMGATEVYACCTHPILSGNALDRLNRSVLKELVVTDSLPLPPGAESLKVMVLSIAPLFADAIRRIHADRSVSELFEGRG